MPDPSAPMKEIITDFFIQLKRLLTNVTFLLIMASIAVVAISTQGLVTFGPLYIEKQFFIPASSANLTLDATAALSAAVGAGLGSVVLFFFKNPDRKGKNAALLSWVLSVIGLPFGLAYLFTCPNAQIVGVNQSCIMDSFTTNISGNFNESGMGSSPTAITGICGATQCQLLGPFMVLIGIGVLILYSHVVPLVFVTLRCVASKERPLSLGVVSFCARALDSIPGPIITRALFDSACLLRNTLQEQCGLTGNCLVYDNRALSIWSLSLFLMSVGISAIFGFFSWLSYRVPKQVKEKEGVVKNEEEDGVVKHEEANQKEGTEGINTGSDTV